MNDEIQMPQVAESESIQQAQQKLAGFIQEFYVSKPNPEERLIDIRDDGKNGCSTVMYFDKKFTDRVIRMVGKEQLILGVKDEPTLDWIDAMPWEHAIWLADGQYALQLHCAPITMSNGEVSDVFAVQFPVSSSFIEENRHITQGKLVRFNQDKKTDPVRILGQVKKEFTVLDIS